MNLTIYRGCHEVGGTCIDIASANTRLILDVGLPLGDAKRDPFDSSKALRSTREELIADGTIPPVPGLFTEESEAPDTILISHAHLDHVGLLHHTRPSVPIYAARGTSKMMLAGAVSAKRPSLDRDRHQPISPGLPFHFDIRDGQKVRRVKGFADLKATEQHATEMERKAARVRAGYIDPAEAQALRPLAEHLRDYADVLRAKGDMEKHVRDTVARCSALFAGCEFALPLDAEAGKAAEWLVNQRRDGPPVELPSGVDTFRPSEAAALLGVTKSALNRSLQRHGLTATGKGKARRIPRTSVETLAAVAVRGVGPATVNHTVRAVRGFFRWLVKAKRIGSNPLESLTLLNAAVDVRRTRRELTADELHRLFTAARESGRTFRGLTGTDRFTLYLTAAGTGFRANALAKLTPADFDLEAAGSVVTLAARFNK